jgi:serine/threonine-protein kinase
MGEVYRARDTKLNRDVALKILPEAFAIDGDRIARFRREAQVLASLNHPNIAAIYGFEDSGRTHALVLELVEGPTLADRIAKGAIPLDEALPIAKQIAEALEAAHEQAIIHRDLKPANVKLRDDGTVKVLDFGLAKAMEPTSAISPSLTNSPTITTPAMVTGVGTLLGTAAYMSPEQAKGRPADKRSDVWAFGCVLYEMLTGKRAFEAEDVSDTLAEVLRGEPDWKRLPDDIPPRLREMLRRCLEKDPRKRLAQIVIARYEMDERVSDFAAALTFTPSIVQAPWWRRAIPFTLTAALSGAIVAGMMFALRSAAPPSVVARFTLTLDKNTVFTSPFLRGVAISPDGTRIVYAANRQAYMRSMSDPEARPIPGTDALPFIGAPTFSPDGAFISFWTGGAAGGSANVLKKIPIGGGTADTLLSTNLPYGISWDNDGILFAQTNKGILRVSERGGEPELLVSLSADETASDPQMLPDGQTVLFTVATGVAANGWDKAQVVVQSLKSGKRKTVVARGQAARYIPTGHLVYMVGGVMFAVPFDLRRLEAGPGAAVSVVEGVLRTTGNPQIAFDAHFSISRNGSIVYIPGPANVDQLFQFDLAWTDRTGTVQPLRLAPRAYQHPRLSPDGRRLAFGIDDGKDADIWVYEVSGTSMPRRLTYKGHNRYPVWFPDSQRVAFQSDREGDVGIFWQRADVSGTAERLTRAEPGAAHIPQSWSKNDILLFDVRKDSTVSLWTFSLSDKKTAAFGGVQSSDPTGAVFSPDGRWVAYSAKTLARTAAQSHYIYVQPFPATGEVNQISVETDDGHHPLWSLDGKELFFIGPGRFNGVGITTQPKFEMGRPVVIARGFTQGNGASGERSYDVSRDGQRFIGVVIASDPGRPASFAGPQINVVTNWFEELKQRVPVK